MIYSSFHITEKNIPYYVKSLNKFRPDAIDGFFTCMCDVASYIERHNIPLKFRPVAVFPTSETLTQSGRDLLERVFGCKVYDQYASSEGAPFVTECKDQKLHIELATGVFEHLSEDDTEILVTSFTTYGTPLIRYRIGDRMEFDAPDGCSCGMSGPLVRQIQGRRLDFLYTPDGAKINAGNVANLLKNLPNVIIRAQLKPDNWNEITPDRIVPDEYIFVYLLTPSKYKHQIISEYAKISGLKVAAIVNINGRYEPLDKNFAHYPINDCGPEEFLAYMRDAAAVFTDSFHGLCFSINFNKDFYLFIKEGNAFNKARNNRFESLLRLTGLESRIINGISSAKALLSIDKIDYTSVNSVIEDMRNFSLNWLEDQLRNSKAPAANRLLYIADTTRCTGCAACANTCPKNCIKMTADNEGFLRPVIDTAICVECRACENVCPVLHHTSDNDILTAYAAKSTSDALSNSTSGGVAYELSKHVIDQGGIVYGCALDENLHAHHIRVDNANDLCKLSKSKYVQSEIGDSFKRVKEDLVAGKSVMFTGLPCQVYALRNYLNKEYDNLLLVDLICHGVPSPGVWDRYVKEVAENNGAQPVSVNFRDKSNGYAAPKMKFSFADGSHSSVAVGEDPYFRCFLMNLFLRESCHNCSFKGGNRVGDITLGDFYGIEKIIPEYAIDNKGVSVVLVYNEKGRTALLQCDDFLNPVEVDAAAALKQNGLYWNSARKPSKRNTFFEEYARGVSVGKYFKKNFKRILLINWLKKLPGFAQIYRLLKSRTR